MNYDLFKRDNPDLAELCEQVRLLTERVEKLERRRDESVIVWSEVEDRVSELEAKSERVAKLEHLVDCINDAVWRIRGVRRKLQQASSRA